MNLLASLLLVLLLSITTQHASAKFGVVEPHAEPPAEGNTMELPDVVYQPDEALVRHIIQLSEDKLPLQAAVDVAAVLESAKADPQTQELVKELRNQEEVAALVSETPQPEIVTNLHAAVEEMKLLDVLFSDPERALRLMQEEGMIPEESVAMYREDPTLLEQDTRRGLYFSFCSFAVAAGLL